MHPRATGTTSDQSDLPPFDTAVPTLDVGGTHVTAALVDARTLSVVPDSKRRHELDSAGPADAILAVLAAALADVAAAAADRGLRLPPACGLAMPDPFDYERGIALFTGVGKFEQLYGVDVRSELLRRIGSNRSTVRSSGPARTGPTHGAEVGHDVWPRHDVRPVQDAWSVHDVWFLNDADAFVLGEWVSGAARGTKRCVAITLGTGIGSGWLADGRAVSDGDTVPPGGRAHRLSVDGIPLEDIVSRRAIRRAYAGAIGRDPVADVREIAERARAGDTSAVDVLEVAFTGLGRALGPLFTRFAPDVVVVGGSMAASWDLFEPSVVRGMGTAGAPRFAVTSAGEDAALVGAARHTLDRTADTMRAGPDLGGGAARRDVR